MLDSCDRCEMFDDRNTNYNIDVMMMMMMMMVMMVMMVMMMMMMMMLMMMMMMVMMVMMMAVVGRIPMVLPVRVGMVQAEVVAQGMLDQAQVVRRVLQVL